jgi:Uma2 family endonuclease
MPLLSLTLPRPRPARPALTTDVEQLRLLAERLNGRPVPGVRMTERQFVAWSTPGALPAEWVDGEVILMTTPSGEHVDLNVWILRFMAEFVEHHDLGLVRMPFTARLSAVGARRDPDVLFVSKPRLHLLRDNHLEGPPDLAVEIVSPDSVSRDWRTKYQEYESAGVREYWIVDPLTRRFEAHALHRKKYRLLATDDEGRVHSKVLKGLYVHPAWLWQSPLPRMATVLKELGVR